MKYHVLGLGAIGTLISYNLRRALPATHSVVVIHKDIKKAIEAREKGSLVKMESNGVTLTEQVNEHQVFDSYQKSEGPPKSHPYFAERYPKTAKKADMNLARAHKLAQPILEASSSPIESLFVCLKAQDTGHALRDLLPRLSPDSTIVLLQNGMGVYEYLVNEIFRNPQSRPHFIQCVNTHGAWMKGHMHTVHAGVGQLKFGIVPDPRGRNFEKSLKLNINDIQAERDDPEFEHYRSLRSTILALNCMSPLQPSWKHIWDIHMEMRRKLVVNSVINPLTAIMGCRNGELFDHAPARELCRDICTEAEAVFRAQWEDEARKARQGEDYRLHFPDQLSAESLSQECYRVASVTEKNYSSMLVDARRGMPTEVNFMNGHLIYLGRQYGVRAPVNQTVMDLVQLRSRIPFPAGF